jgi:CRP-like cAMP-binding protein
MPHSTTIKLLKQVPLFAGITEGEAAALAHASEKKRFKRGDKLVEQGQTTFALFVILSGNANVLLSASNGKQFSVATLGVGECIGEMSFLDSQPHSATVLAASSLDVLLLRQQAFNEVLHQNSNITAAIFRTLAKRLHITNLQIVRLYSNTVQGRVAKLLMDMAMPTEAGELQVKSRFTQTGIADKVGASREMVGRALKDLEIKGFIRKMRDGSVLIREQRSVARPD